MSIENLVNEVTSKPAKNYTVVIAILFAAALFMVPFMLLVIISVVVFVDSPNPFFNVFAYLFYGLSLLVIPVIMLVLTRRHRETIKRYNLIFGITLGILIPAAVVALLCVMGVIRYIVFFG